MIDVKVIVTSQSGSKTDISKMVCQGLEVSGSSKECARTLTFELGRGDFDVSLTDFRPRLGETVTCYQVFESGNQELFFKGVIWEKKMDINSATVEFTCYDRAIYLNNNEPKTQVFTNKAPGDIAKSVIGDLGLKAGTFAKGSKMNYNGRGQVAYDIIMGAYTKESQKSGKYFKLMAEGDKINVLETGQLKAKSPIKELKEPLPGKLLSCTYTQSLDELVNEVKTVEDEKDDKKDQKKENAKSKKRFGQVQKVVKGKPGNVEGLLKDGKIDIDVECLGDWSMVTGRTAKLESTFISGEFFIISDTHTLDDGSHKVKLALSSQNEMDEKGEGESPEEGNGQGQGKRGKGKGGSASSSAVMQSALKYEGTIYSQPNRMADGYTDCSSLVYKAVMDSMGRDRHGTRAPSTYDMPGRTDLRHEISFNDLQPGDILRRSGHTEIYAGNGQSFGAHRPGIPAGYGLYNRGSRSRVYRVNGK